jgi:hypothetical protein
MYSPISGLLEEWDDPEWAPVSMNRACSYRHVVLASASIVHRFFCTFCIRNEHLTQIRNFFKSLRTNQAFYAFDPRSFLMYGERTYATKFFRPDSNRRSPCVWKLLSSQHEGRRRKHPPKNMSSHESVGYSQGPLFKVLTWLRVRLTEGRDRNAAPSR